MAKVSRQPPGCSQKRALSAAILAVLALISVVATLGDPGVTWDEPLYIKASRGYMAWLGLLRSAVLEKDTSQPFSDVTIARWWVQDPTLELHPPLAKVLSGLTWAVMRGRLSDLVAHRMSTALLLSLIHI